MRASLGWGGLAVEVALAVLAASCGQGGPGGPEQLVQFAEEGNPCSRTDTLYVSDDVELLFCDSDENNYSGPLFPSDIDTMFADASDSYRFTWGSDRDRDRWRHAVEEAAQRLAGPRLAKRKACPGKIPEVELSESTQPKAGGEPITLTITLSPAPGTVTLTWAISLWDLDWPVNGVSPETKEMVGRVQAGFGEGGLQTATVHVPGSGTASEAFAVFAAPSPFRTDYGMETFGLVWINAESSCGSIASTRLTIN